MNISSKNGIDNTTTTPLNYLMIWIWESGLKIEIRKQVIVAWVELLLQLREIYYVKNVRGKNVNDSKYCMTG